MITFSTGIFYRRVPGFATDCPCRVLCRGLSTCLLWVSPLLGIKFEIIVGLCVRHNGEQLFHCFNYALHIS